MKRRKFLKLGVTGGAVGVLSPFGGAILPHKTRALSLGPGPSRLMTIYMPGGWMPSMFFAPFREASQVAVHWPSYLADPSQVRNLDGSGDAPNADDPTLGRVRIPHLWDPAIMENPSNFSRGAPWPTNDPKTSYGFSWSHYGLAENMCVVHGVDQQTAEHFSGRRAALSGIAGARFSVPSMHSVAAHAHALAGTGRPLGAVTISTNGPWGSTPKISHVDLPAHAAATSIAGLDSLVASFSDQSSAWDGLRHRDDIDLPNYMETERSSVPLTRMDQYALRRFRAFRGLSDDSFYERLYEAYSGLSRKMALDLVTILEATPGWESPNPHWSVGNSPYQVSRGRVYGDNGETWDEQFELALKLFKADVCTAINVQAAAPNGEGFDIHGGGESNMKELFNRTRGVVEVIGRFLGEMKATPIGGGRTLLDDTLVVLVSEFGRSWPSINTSNGHWPFTSYIFAGGGIHTNRMIGDYALDPRTPNNPTGVPVEVDGGSSGVVMKAPAARDVARTIYRVMGIPDDVVEIFGGANEILGVRAV